MTNSDYYKIGFTNRNAERRLSDLQTACPCALEIIATLEGSEDQEKELHRLMWKYRTNGGDEWFEFDKATLERIISYDFRLNEHKGSINRASAYDVRSVRGGQFDPTPNSREDVSRSPTAFDDTCHKYPFLVGGGKY